MRPGGSTCFLMLFVAGIFSNSISSQDVNPEQWKCDSLGNFIETIFREDRIEDPDVIALAPDLYQAMLDKHCPEVPDAMNLLGLIYYNRSETILSKRILLQEILSLESIHPERNLMSETNYTWDYPTYRNPDTKVLVYTLNTALDLVVTFNF